MLEDQIEQLRRDARNSRAEVERLKQDNYRIHKHREELEAEVERLKADVAEKDRMLDHLLTWSD